jgi:hypothetical protein
MCLNYSNLKYKWLGKNEKGQRDKTQKDFDSTVEATICVDQQFWKD